jgi:protein TonB
VTYGQRLLACAAISLGAHLVLQRGASLLPEREASAPPRPVTVRVIDPPPPPAPEPEPEPEVAPPEPAEIPEPMVTPTPRPPRRQPKTAEPPAPAAASEAPATSESPPKFGVTMQSTSQGGSGPALPTGQAKSRPTDQPANGGGGAPAAQEGTGTAEAYEVTVMPLPRGRCTGKYTEAARQAAVEGTVVLDLVVGADGRAKNIKVVSGLGHGLNEAAVAALKACRFTPGERSGVPVPVRIREFKIRFFLDQG